MELLIVKKRILMIRKMKYLLILIIALLASNLVYAMTCNSLNNDPTHQGCFEIKTQIYNSTTPVINVTFQESVEVIDYELYKIGELGTVIPNNPFNESFLETLSNSDTYDLIPTETSDSLQFRPSIHISNGVYLFKIRAFNVPNVDIDVAVIFKINGTGMNFWVYSPTNGVVSIEEHPNFAFTNESIFDLILQTERDIDECRFTPFTIPSTMPLAQAYDEMTTIRFNTTDSRYAIFPDFNISQFYPYPEYDGNVMTMAVICKEISDRYAFNMIYVGVDVSPPTIEVGADPSPVVDAISRKTNVSILTSDRSACSIQKINPPTSPLTGNKPNITRHQNYDFSLFNEFVKSYSETFFFSDYPNPNIYRYNVSCTNLAGLKSSREFSVPVDLKVIQSFEFYSPSTEGYVNKTSVFLNGSASIGTDAECTYSINGTAPYTKLKKENGFTIEGRQVYTASISGLTEGAHTLYVNCTYMTSFNTIDFVVDRTAPTPPNITTGNESCSLERITARVVSADNVSGVDRYFYNLTLRAGSYSESGISSSGHLSINLDEDEIASGGLFTLKVRAIDNAGNLGAQSVRESIKVTNSTAVVCDTEKPIISVNATFNQTAKVWKITVNCRDEESGCKSSFNYGTQTNSSKTCNETLTGTLLSTVIPMNQPGEFCAKVYDNNNNFDSFSRDYNIAYPPTCSNGVKDAGETAIDCGGNCSKCPINATCKVPDDCVEGICTNGKCAAPSCTDKIKNGNETGIDCGGNCAKCFTPNATCTNNASCPGGMCLNGKCVAITCSDKIKNGDETGVDCGGSCPACFNVVNKSCTSNANCSGGLCISGKCVASTCADKIRNGDETGVDCGGSCLSCKVGSGCTGDADCETSNCMNGTCKEASCTDLKKDGKESDVDCGGDCKDCARYKKCIANGDCATAYCDIVSKTCNIDPTLDTDKDGLTDVWEEKNCGSITGCDPKKDIDDDGYSNEEEFEASTDPLDALDYPDYKKYSTASIIFLILGALMIISGIVLKVLNVMDEEKKRTYAEQKEMMGTLSQIPKMSSLDKTIPERALTEEEKMKGKQARLKALKERDSARKKMINQFDTGEGQASKLTFADAGKEKPENKASKIFEDDKSSAKQPDKKLTSTKEGGEDEYVVLTAAPEKQEEDAFSKLKKIAGKNTTASKETKTAISKDVKESKESGAKETKDAKEVKDSKKEAVEKPKVTKYYSKSKPAASSKKNDDVFEKLKTISKTKKK